jgi:hypothetical protein
MKADHRSYAILPAERDTNHMVPLSPFSIFRRPPGARCRTAFRNSLDLARHLNELGYRRHWMVKHHNLVGYPERGTAVALAVCIKVTLQRRYAEPIADSEPNSGG